MLLNMTGASMESVDLGVEEVSSPGERAGGGGGGDSDGGAAAADSAGGGGGDSSKRPTGLRTGVLRFIKGTGHGQQGQRQRRVGDTDGLGFTGTVSSDGGSDGYATGILGDTGGSVDGVLMGTVTVGTEKLSGLQFTDTYSEAGLSASLGEDEGEINGEAERKGRDQDQDSSRNSNSEDSTAGASFAARLQRSRGHQSPGRASDDLESTVNTNTSATSMNTEEAKDERHRAYQAREEGLSTATATATAAAAAAAAAASPGETITPSTPNGPLVFATTRASKDEIYGGRALEFMVSAVRLEHGPLAKCGSSELHLVVDFLGATSALSSSIPVAHGSPLVQTDFAAHMSFARPALTLLSDELESAGESLCALLLLCSADGTVHASAEVFLWCMVDEGAPIVRQEMDLFSPSSDLCGSAVVDVRGHYLFSGLA